MKYGFKTRILLVLIAVLAITTILNVLLAAYLSNWQNRTAAYASLDRTMSNWRNDLQNMIDQLRDVALAGVNEKIVLDQLANIEVNEFNVDKTMTQVRGFREATRSLGYRKMVSINRLHLILRNSGFSSIAVYTRNRLSHYVSATTAGMSVHHGKNGKTWIAATADNKGNLPLHRWPGWNQGIAEISPTLDMKSVTQPIITFSHPTAQLTAIEFSIPVQGMIHDYPIATGQINEPILAGSISERVITNLAVAHPDNQSPRPYALPKPETFAVLVFRKLINRTYLEKVMENSGIWPVVYSPDGRHRQQLLTIDLSLQQMMEELHPRNVASPAKEGFQGTINTDQGSFYTVVQQWAFEGKPRLTLAMAMPSDRTRQNIRQTVVGILIIAGIILLGCITIGVFWIGRYIDPVVTLTHAVRNIAQTNLLEEHRENNQRDAYTKLQPIDINARDEIGELAAAFNIMIAKLRESFDTLEHRVQQRSVQLRVARDAAQTANKAKSVFLANMSHELRTPLNAILGFSELMTRDTQINDEQKETLEIINRSGHHLLNLINDVLDMSKIEAGHFNLEIEPVDLENFVTELVEMMRNRAEGKDLQLLLDQSSQFPRLIKTDQAKLRQIIINLLGNAIKFTENGGVILRLNAHDRDPTHIVLRIEVEDTGIGINEHDLERIFEPFEQIENSAMQKGTGLGLALTKQYVELLNGAIGVESTPGKGTLFYTEIPVEQTSENEIFAFEPEHGRVLALTDGQPEWRILIVEDQTDNRLLLKSLLENVGFHVRMATNGLEAIELFKQWHPHLICMDRRMPLMDGLEATQRIRKLPGGDEVKIISITASVFGEQKNETMTIGSDDFIRKPYQPDEVFDSIAKLLNIEFLYEKTNDESEQTTLEKISLDELQRLPDEWQAKFAKAVRMGDTQQMLSLTDTLDSKNTTIKNKLKNHIKGFHIQCLSQLFLGKEKNEN